MGFDVVISGAGPAGSTVGALLAKKGFSVALVDKASFPRDKVCGGAVSPRALSSLDELGLLSKFVKMGFRKINGVRVSSPDGSDVFGDAPKGTPYRNYGYTVLRTDFDEMLRGYALDSGVEFMGGSPVIDLTRDLKKNVTGLTIRKDGKTDIGAKVVIGADGAGSIVAKKAGLFVRDLQNIAVASRVVYSNVTDIEDYVEFHYDKSVLPGYAWIFPLADDKVNIGLGGLSPKLKRAGVDVFHLLDQFTRKNRWAKGRLGKAKVEMKPAGWPLPMGGRTPQTVANGVLLLGDAAHHINPLTGEGIEYCLEGGMMASDVITKVLEKSSPTANALGEFDRRWREKFVPDFEDSIKIRNMMERISLVNMLVKRAKKKKELADTLAGLIANMLPKDELNTKFKWIKKMYF